MSILALIILPKSDAASSGINLFIAPPMYVAEQQGESFNMTINVTAIDNLRSFSFEVTYNTSLLRVAEVFQGPLFPPPPRSYFRFENNTSLGFLGINSSLDGSEAPVSGNGTLALITFKVVSSPNGIVSSPLDLIKTTLLDSRLNPIAHDAVGAVFFWKSTLPDPPIEGRLLDVYTQRGGIGPGQLGGEFVAGEEVNLISLVSYNDDPVQQKLVAFQVQNPLGEFVTIRTAITNEDGIAMISFRIPATLGSNGTWRAISVVDIAEQIAWDTIYFGVKYVPPLGGGSTSLKQDATVDLLTPYDASILAAVLAIVALKRRRK
jgi:hypothetical protein